VLASKFGADCNLLVSPLKVKLCCPWLDEELPREDELLEDELLPAIAGFKSCHGTATCLPLEDEEPEEPEDNPEELLDCLLEDEPVEEEVPELEPPAALAPPEAPDELLKERIAKSIRPEAGFTI